MANLLLTAPLQGWVSSLEETPDPVFAQRMLGDGLAIDPTGASLHAPCAGQVIGVHHSRHAVSLRADNGAEILIHIGLDTVALGGAGFEVHVRDGQSIRPGDLLISFDLDLLAGHARSLITPIILTNGEAFAIARREQDREAMVGDPLMEIVALGAASQTAAPPPGGETTRRVTIPLAHGLHARPAARVSGEAKRFTADLTLATADRRANARSPVALLALGLSLGDEALITGAGLDAEAAVAALADLIEHGLGEEAAPVASPRSISPAALPQIDGVLTGVRAVPGLAIGVSVRIAAAQIEIEARGAGCDHEARALAAALDAVRARLNNQIRGGTPEQRTILEAHLAILDDPDLGDGARDAIAGGASAGSAWRGAVDAQVQVLRALADARIAERADDLIDLEHQVLSALTGETGGPRTLPNHAILLAQDLLPSQLMALDPARIAGVCTARGGPTSHVAILAAAMNIPTVVAAGPGVMAVEDGVTLILDGDAGTLRVAPTSAQIETTQMRLAASQARRTAARAAAAQDCRMADGTRIEVFANLGSLADAHAAVDAGAEGCGLLRTEFLFLDRRVAPSEDEQFAQYQAIASALGDRPLIIRTLDVGADKQVAYLDIPAEDNPALGLRGVRVGLWRPDLLRAQLRAILRVQPAGQCRIMLPMISSLAELAAARAMLDELRDDLGITTPVPLGVMIETPAAAVTADLLAAEADFLSIGSNDLTQYALAMDRGNPRLADQIDGLHPAVLRLIHQAAQGGRRHGRLVGVCGGLASDLAAAPILIGLGVSELSATPAIVPELKALIRTLTGEACEDLARRAMAQTSAADVRALTSGAFP